MGKIIVFEGIDGSGKSTQYGLLCRTLEQEGIRFRSLTFQQYDEPSSTLIRMYLSGQFGSDPGSVNAYAASSFFAADRYASYVDKWGEYYGQGGLIVTDRYTTSNAIHQACKLCGAEREEYFRWLYDYEFTKMGLPAPDMVIYLQSPVELGISRLRSREAQTHTTADIHEKDDAYLRKCHDCGLEAARHYGWRIVEALSGDRPRTEQEIAQEIVGLVREAL